MRSKRTIFSGAATAAVAGLVLCFAPVDDAAAATVNATSCSQSAVQTAVDAASSGDTVTVPAGICAWSTPVQVSQAITLRGAGIGVSVINGSINAPYGTGMVQYSPSAAEAVKTFELSGFTFDAKYATGCFMATAPTSLDAITGLKIHDNRFVNGNSRAIILSGLEFGVFYRNQFQDNYIAISSIGSEMAGWNYPLAQGGPNYPYFEDNTFNQTVARGGFIVETGRGGRIVFRHNTISNYGGSGGEVFDAHGVNGTFPTDTGTVSAEYYHNTIGLAVSTRVLFHRGGKMVFANNVITGGGSLQMTEYQGWSYCTAAPYPKPDQVNNSFYWNNSIANPGLYCPSGACTSCNQYDTMYIQQNRDYFYPTAGLASSRPATCTANTYYGTTDTDVVYKCGSGNAWSVAYQPYPYPHPLISGSPLASPTNLQAM